MTKEMITKALRTAGHYIDIANNTIYVSAAFNKKSEIYGTPECQTMTAILNAFPGIEIQVQTSSRKNSVIPYDLMEKYIKIMPDAAGNLIEFERIKKMSRAYRSAYRFVADWFETKFPHYGELLVKDEKTGKITWNAVEQYKMAQAESKKTAEVEAAAKPVEEKPAESSNVYALPVAV